MPTVTAGNNVAVTISGDQTIDISVNHNNSGRFQFVPSNSSSVMGDGGTGLSFGPMPMSKTYGPFGVAGTITVFCDVGTVTYTVNSSAFNAIAVTGGTINGTTVGASTASTGAFTTLSASSTVSGTGFTNYLAAPPSIGTTTAGIVRTSELRATFTDSSGTPGAVTNNSPRGKAAFAAAASSIVVTNSLVAATSSVFVVLESADATLTSILRVTPAAGSFTVTGNAAATAAATFSFLVVN